MAIANTYRGIPFIVPETDEEDWGDQGTNMLVALLDGGDETEFTSVADDIVAKRIVGADLVIAAAGTITWTANHHVVTGDAAPVTVDAVTGISAGEEDRQPLRLVGGSDTNTVTLEFAGNVNPNGPIVLRLGSTIDLEWDLTNTEWVEASRRN